MKHPSHPLVAHVAPAKTRRPHLLLYGALLWTICGSMAVPSVSGAYSGPVYVNPDAVAQSSSSTVAGAAGAAAPAGQITQTVYGFLDFTTTIGNTVMVFSPQSAPPVGEAPKKAANPVKPTIETRPSSSIAAPAQSEIKPSPAAPVKSTVGEKKSSKGSLSSVVEVRVSAAPAPPAPAASPAAPAVTFFSSIVEVRSSGDAPTTPAPPPDAGTSNNLLGPEVYDFLSKQPAEIVDETYKVYDIKPSSSKASKHRASSDARAAALQSDTSHGLVASRLSIKGSGASSHPIGLISSMGGTVVREGVTTVHETRVIGTYISGKYAQVVESTSTIKQNPLPGSPAIRPSPSLRILKTAAPTGPGINKIHLDPTPAGGSLVEETVSLEHDDSLATRPLRRSAVAAGRSEFLSRLHRSRVPSDPELDEYEAFDLEVSPRVTPSSSNARKPSSRIRGSQSVRPSFSSRFTNSRFRSSPSEQLATVSVFTEPARSYSTASVNPGGGRRFTSYNRNRNSGANNNNNNNGSSGSTRSAPSAGGASSSSSEAGYTRRGYKPRHSSSQESGASHGSANSNHGPTSAPATSLNKFKLTRPAGRWQYKTSPKPRVTIRQQRPTDLDVTPSDDNELNALTPPASHAALTSPQPGRGEEAGSEEGGPSTEALPASGGGELQAEGAEDHHVLAHAATEPLPTPTAETIKVEISTPVDFSDVYYEIATIKSPYTFQVGTLKNTRFITVTSTLERSLAASNEAEISPTEPLTENILATSTLPPFDVNQLPADASVATLPAILLASDVETPPLETVTETFNTTQLLLKTHILPVVHQGGSIQTTKMLTLVQSYHVTRFVTAVKTLPPAEAFQFLPSRSLNEFNSRLDEAGSELHELELSENEQEGEGEERRIFPPDLMGLGDLASVGVDFDVAAAERQQQQKNSISPSTTSTPALPEPSVAPALSNEQLQHLALLRYLNPLAPVPAITTSRPVLRMETVYESHVIPVWNGLSTSYSTISRPIATISKTEYEIATVVPPAPTVPGFGQQFTITSTPIVTQTVVTQTESKILKLTFGAKTVFSTLFSTRVVPTVLTTYLTTQVAVQPTAAAFPGFFPGGFPGFPFVG